MSSCCFRHFLCVTLTVYLKHKGRYIRHNTIIGHSGIQLIPCALTVCCGAARCRGGSGFQFCFLSARYQLACMFQNHGPNQHWAQRCTADTLGLQTVCCGAARCRGGSGLSSQCCQPLDVSSGNWHWAQGCKTAFTKNYFLDIHHSFKCRDKK